jgi:hypothetical protein
MSAARLAKSTTSAPGEQAQPESVQHGMTGLFVIMAAAAQSAEVPAEPSPASFNPYAVEVFQRDWVLNQWAKRSFDTNGDGAISAQEAQPAANAFKQIADGDSDGRVTPYEYERAREFILARY